MPSNYLHVLVPRPSARTAGTTAVTLTTVSTPVLCYNFVIQAGSANTGIVWIGNSATQNISLDPEESFSATDIYGTRESMQYDLSAWYVRGSASGQVANILATVKQIQRP